ncbi:MAG: aldo/keto reductase [archaeon]|nr:aldo/keto reductase [archaeon]
MKEIPFFTLNNGIKIPSIGIGPGSVLRGNHLSIPIIGQAGLLGKAVNKVVNKIYFVYKSRKYVKSLANCLRLGYRLIDYSAAYENEELISKAIKKSGLKREDVFITTRVTNNQQYDGNIRNALLESLKKMKLDYIDLYMFHWPVTGCYVNTYKEMEKLYKEGYIKALGVCNCHQHHLQEILSQCEIVPALNQFEVHPLFTQKPLIAFCKEKNIQVEAYTPLARNDDRLQKNLIIRNICKKYGKSIAQVILRWDYQQGIVTIPRSSNPKRQAANIDIFDFELTEEEIKAIDSININSRLRFDPDNLDFHSVG